MPRCGRIGQLPAGRVRVFRRWIGLAALLAAAQLISPSARAEPPRLPRSAPAQREVTVVNRSNRPVYQLRVSPSDADQWGDDRLGDDSIPVGGSFRVRLGRTRDCQFDIQVIYDDASREEQRGVDLCHKRSVTFDRSAAIMPPEPFAVEHSVRLDNQSGRPIREIFISPGSVDRWGDDLAPAGGIAQGSTGEIAYRGGCVADLRLVFDNRSAEERHDVDICAMPELIIRPGWTTADTPFVPPRPEAENGAITLLNGTGSAITEFYLRPEDPALTAQDGDLLGNAVLAAGARLRVTFDRGTACRFIAHIRHGGDRPEQVQIGIDLCRSSTIALEPARSG